MTSLIILLCFSWKIFQIHASEDKTVLAMKEELKRGSNMMYLKADSFKELIENSDIFFDRTLLIKEILEDPSDSVVVNLPPKWCKTVNMKMLENFLEIQVDKQGNRIEPINQTCNYRLFKKGEVVTDNGNKVEKLTIPLLIAGHEDLMEKYLGKYPVIYIHFGGIEGYNFHHVVLKIKEKIARCFERHDYMKIVLEKKLQNVNTTVEEKNQAQQDLNMFKNLVHQKASHEEAKQSLFLLSKILHEHFGQKVFLFVDEYDAPLNETLLSDRYMRSHENTVIEFYQNLLSFSLQNNSHIEKAFFTGVIQTAKGTLIPHLNNATEHNALDNKLYEFYNFGEKEGDILFDVIKVSRHTRVILKIWYLGYKVKRDSDLRHYDQLALLYAVHNKPLPSPYNGLLQKFFAVDAFREAMCCLVSGVNLPNVNFTNVYFDRIHFQLLVQAHNEKSYGLFTYSGLKYLYSIGYLTYMDFVAPADTRIFLRFPNERISTFMKSELMLYYEKQLRVDPEKLKFYFANFKNHFVEFAGNFEKRSELLESHLFTYLVSIFGTNGNLIPYSEDLIRATFDYMLMYCDTLHRVLSFTTYIALYDDIGGGVIIGATVNANSTVKALELAKMGKNLLLPVSILKKIKFIGINIVWHARNNLTIGVRAEANTVKEVFG